jgi:predicted MPP superfamily phosphohydrolase
MPFMTRRRFLAGTLTAVAGVAGAYSYARMVERHWLDIARVEHALPKLPDAFTGFTIAQLSDIHFGPLVEPASLEPVIDEVLAFHADVIVITGDLISRVSEGEPDMIVQSLSRLHAPHGVFAILGNHDWWEDAAIVTEALQRAGAMVLANAHVALRRGGQVLYFAGVDDVWCGKSDLEQTLRGTPSDAAVIALVHEPDYADIAARDPRILLQLSGHSHGGQVRVPFWGGLYFPPWGRKYPLGKYQIGNLTLYTNRGLGVVNRPLRFACRPEITLHTLKPAC